MRKVQKFYATFNCPGFIVAEAYNQDILTSNPNDVVFPQNAYSFRIFKREDIVDGKNIYQGKPEQIGPEYYHPDSKIKTLAELKKGSWTNNKILISNMECNNWDKVIFSRWKTWPQPYNKNEIEILDHVTE